ncbi:MAG: hypothetical protein ACRC3Z_10160 [Phocaeicola sp.]
MKKIYNNIVVLLMMACTLFACSPDKYELGDMDLTRDDLVEGIAFQIVHDATNPNIVYLESKLSSQYTVLWEHPQGRSQENRVTLRIPFEGEYNVTFGVQTRGGAVYGVPATFTVADFCAEFVNDELWTLLTGGVGSSKTWLMDVDAEGVCRYFSGPLHFYGTDDCWDNITAGQTLPDGSDSWSWAADWAGNGSWLFGSTGAMDYGSMTFDLVNGANITVVDNYNNRTTVGTFLLDTDNHTMRMTDAGILHDPGRDAIVTQWGNIKVLSLTANAMQLGVIRDNDPSEGPCLLVYNFISEDYKNNWTPAQTEDPKPELPDGWQEDISQVVTSTIVWKLSADNPFDWATLYGERMNGFQSMSDYPDWCTPNSQASNVTLTLDSRNSVYAIALPDGTEVEGAYTLDSEGIYTFDNGLASYIIGSDWVNFTASSDNQLRVLSYEKNTSGIISDLWLGLPELDGSGKVYQYMAYHFVAQMDEPQTVTYESRASYFDQGWSFTESNYVGISKDGTYTYTITGSNDSPQGFFFDVFSIQKEYPNASLELVSVVVDGSALSFDPELVNYCEGDNEGDARIYIYNPWAGDGQAFTMDQFAYQSSIEVNVKVSFNE